MTQQRTPGFILLTIYLVPFKNESTSAPDVDIGEVLILSRAVKLWLRRLAKLIAEIIFISK